MTEEKKLKMSNFWFTHAEHVWKSELHNWKPDFVWTDRLEKWTWDNCSISAQKINNEIIRIMIRSKGKVNTRISKDSTQESEITFSYNFDVTEIPDITTEDNFIIPHNEYQKETSQKETRRVLRLIKINEKDLNKNKCEIWEWASESGLDKIKQMLDDIKNTNSSKIEPIPTISIDDTHEFYPVIYQPAIDTAKNFLRQVHIHKNKENLFEVSLVFNNEELRQNGILNGFYEDIRKVIYGRTKDIETFQVMVIESIPTKFIFEGIYSENKTVLHDTTHGDKKHWWNFNRVPKRDVDLYYSSTRFPKIFVNTSNHALAGHDNNRNLWKWEYITWGENLPIGVGNKSRKKIESDIS
ncbi:MAG: hypothetical protein ACR2LL_07170 [Nitrosopumilus sp.]